MDVFGGGDGFGGLIKEEIGRVEEVEEERSDYEPEKGVADGGEGGGMVDLGRRGGYHD